MSTGSDKTDCAHGGDPQWCQFCGRESALQAALTTSQADVTRLAAELAESVRALAVSQGEVERMEALFQQTHRVHWSWVDKANEADRLRCELEGARGLLADAAVRALGVSCQKLTGQNPAEPCGWCLFWETVRAFLAPPTPTASPEPAR